MVDYSAYHWAEKARKHAESMPEVNDSTITITQGGVAKGTFTLNQSSDGTIALDSGGGGTDLPDQTGHAGEYLTTDGTSASWGSITIPTVNNATLTIQKNGTDVATFTANSSTNATANISVPTQSSDIGAQEELVSGTNIKTINNSTILGSGNLNIDSLPSQTGNTGKFLTTDGTDASWAVPKTHNLFDFMWRDAELNDQSWLRADTFSWQDGTVYSDAYNHLVDDIDGKTATSETVGSYTISYYLADDGHKITTDETTVANIYNESGVAWYYVLDTTNQRFKLPRENPAREELIQVLRAKGSGLTLGLTDGTNNAGLNNSTGSDNRYVWTTDQYGQNAGHTSGSSSYLSGTDRKGIGVTTDSTKSGIVSNMTDSTSVYKGKKYLYFYVGQFSQSATEQTAGVKTELLNGKVDLNAANLSTQGKSLISGLGMPSDNYSTLTLLASGNTYTAPANGYFVCAWQGCTAVDISLPDSNYAGFCYALRSDSFFRTIVPVSSGASISISYAGTPSSVRFCFVYAKGEPNV